MAWELFAIWAIVVATTVWFVRDEKRRRRDADIAYAARYYAHAPKYRHVTVEQALPAPPARIYGGLSERQRAFLKALQH